MLLMTDARLGALTLADPLLREVGVVACAAVALPASGPLRGALCVIERRPREWTDRDAAVLDHLAALAAGELELRTVRRQRDEARDALGDSEGGCE
jgi:GAF domain-containing protein